MKTTKTLFGTALICAIAVTANAQNTTPPANGQYSNPCEASPITDFDFWVGHWVAFDYDTGVVQGIDRIEKINNGCTVMQEWTQLTDNYRTPGAPHRYAGMSVNSVLADGRWQQTWIGSAGGTITVRGGLNTDGTMVLESDESTAQNGNIFKRTWYWDPEEDGSVHSWGEIRIKNADGSWDEPQIQWNIHYLSRNASPNLKADTTTG